MLPLRRHGLKSLGVVYPISGNFATEKAAPPWGRSRLSKKADAFSAKGVSLRSAPRSSACGGRFDARSAQSVFPTPQRKQTCRRHVCSVGRSGYAARREPCGCSFSSAASGRRNSARLF